MIARLRELVLLLASLLLALAGAAVVGEIAVRVYEHQPLWPLVPPKPYVDSREFYLRSPTRLYEMRPGIDEEIGYERIRISINGLGFRALRDPAVPKPPGTWRAILLGDSFTFCGKVPIEQTFAAKLEGMLAARDANRRYEVLNFGVPGYKSAQEVAFLREKGLALGPDLVVLDATLNLAAPPVQLVPAHEPAFPRLNRFVKRFHLFQFLQANWKQYGYLVQGRVFQRGQNFADLADGSPRWAATQKDLEELKRVTDANGARLLVVMWPVFAQLDDYPYAAKHALVMDACRRLGIPAIDLLDAFKGMDGRSLWVNPDDHHPNPIAQQKVAETVLAALEEHGDLPPRTKDPR